MHWGFDGNAGWFLGMHLVWWTFWAILAVVAFSTVLRSAARPGVRESPLDVLQRRYAEGAISTAEYEERRATLTSQGAGTVASRP